MMTSDTALESRESIFFNEKIFNVLRTHPEELYALRTEILKFFVLIEFRDEIYTRTTLQDQS